MDRRGPLLLGFTLELLALGLFLCFIGELHRVIATASGGAGVPLATSMLAAWIALSTIVAVGTAPVMALIWRGMPASAAAQVVIVEHTATDTALAISKVMPFVVVGILALWNIAYGRRAHRKGERLGAEAAARGEAPPTVPT